jgi:hypothetical protein
MNTRLTKSHTTMAKKTIIIICVSFWLLIALGNAYSQWVQSAGGSIPIVSSNQGTFGIVWLVLRTDKDPSQYPSAPNNLFLCAFDANDFTTPHSSLLPGGMPSPQLLNDRTSFGTCPGLAFVEPTVINGMVFVPCDGHVSVFF